MWDVIDEINTFQFDCNECNNNYQLPPPKFHIPPPPIPPSLKQFMKCNDDDIIKYINNWDNDMCDVIPTFDTSFYSSPFLHTLILVAVFTFILILVIILSVIYVRRLIKQKNGGCKELKNLVKHHLNQRNHNNITNNNLNKFQTTDDNNYYDDCYNCINEYTISRQAKDFIGYTITTATTTENEQKQQRRNSNIILPISSATSSSFSSRRQFNPINFSYNEQQFNNNQNLNNNNQYSIYNNYSSYFNEPIRHNNYFNHNNQLNNNYQQNQLINFNHKNYEYSQTYEDFIELNNSISPSTTITDDNNSSNSSSSSGIIDSNPSNSNNYPEYVEIELVVPNLVLR